MNYLNFPQKENNIKDCVTALSIVTKPAGYDFDVDTENCVLHIKDLEGKLLKDVKYNFEENVFNNNIMSIFDCELDNGVTLFFTLYYSEKRIDLSISDPNLGIFDISIEIERVCPVIITPDKKLYSTNEPVYTEKGCIHVDKPTVFINHARIDFPGKKYTISYGLYSDKVLFSKKVDESTQYCESYKDHCVGISRGTNNNTALWIEKYDNCGSKSIETYGYEDSHMLGYQIGLPERDAQFSTYYHERGNDGRKLDIDHCYNDAFKHYTNEKLINNENVRNILDEIISNYETLFKYDDYKSGIIGGRLFDAYKNGVPNNSRVANNMLEAVAIPIKKEKRSKRRSK